MSFLDFFKGFVVTGQAAVQAQGHRPVPRGQAAQAGALPRPSRPQPLRGRHGEVHRLRAVRRRVPGPLHLRPRRRQPPGRARCRPGERYGFVYEINFLRCIHCDMCVEACPTEAITESKLFEWSFINREDAIYTKAELLVDDEGRPQELPWEDWKPGDDRNTSAWVRATSPGGAAAMEGEPLWSGELGYGVRPAQKGQSDPPRPTSPADTDLSLREMASGALRGIGVDGTRPVPGHGPGGHR